MQMSPRSTRVAWAVIAPLLWGLLSAISAVAQTAPEKSPVHNVHEIKTALAACMQPLAPADTNQAIQMTVRLGLNAEGQPLGPPRFAYVTPDVPDQIKSEYKSAVLDAIERCAPFSFAPAFGKTIAGVPLILVFDEHGLLRVRVGGSSAYIAPAPLPSPQIAPTAPAPALPQQSTRHEPPIWVPGLATPTPSLPHGPETSQDRRTRCMIQSGLYGVPNANYTQYMGLCAQ